MPGMTPDSLHAELDRIAAATAQIAAEGAIVRYLGSTFAPDEESCFSTIESEAISLVERLCKDADLGDTRIALIQQWPPTPDHAEFAESERTRS